MMAKENEAAGARRRRRRRGRRGPSRPSARAGAGVRRGVVGVQERPGTSAPRPARGAGDRLLDWFEFPEGFERYAARAGASGRAAARFGVARVGTVVRARGWVRRVHDGRVFLGDDAARGRSSRWTATGSCGCSPKTARVRRGRAVTGVRRDEERRRRVAAARLRRPPGRVPVRQRRRRDSLADVGRRRLAAARRTAAHARRARASSSSPASRTTAFNKRALTPRFVAAGLGAPWQVAWIGKNTLRVTFRGGDADASGRDDAARASRRTSRAGCSRWARACRRWIWRRGDVGRRPRGGRRARLRRLERARTARGVDIETLAAATRKTAERRERRRRSETVRGRRRRARASSAAARERRRVAAAFLKKREPGGCLAPPGARGMCPHRALSLPDGMLSLVISKKGEEAVARRARIISGLAARCAGVWVRLRAYRRALLSVTPYVAPLFGVHARRSKGRGGTKVATSSRTPLRAECAPLPAARAGFP